MTVLTGRLGRDALDFLKLPDWRHGPIVVEVDVATSRAVAVGDIDEDCIRYEGWLISYNSDGDRTMALAQVPSRDVCAWVILFNIDSVISVSRSTTQAAVAPL